MTFPTSRLLMIVAKVVVCFSACRLAHAGAAHFTEEYTVWPKDNASRLPENYPWPSCDKTTGSQCPGLIDYLQHFCTREDNQGCQKRNESVSERHVLLNLLPGQHKMDLWKIFSWELLFHQGNVSTTMYPDYFWFCNVSITF